MKWIVEEYLKKNEYDGLVNMDGGDAICSCALDDDDIVQACLPGLYNSDCLVAMKVIDHSGECDCRMVPVGD